MIKNIKTLKIIGRAGDMTHFVQVLSCTSKPGMVADICVPRAEGVLALQAH